MSQKVGKVSQIIGPVVDVSFDTSNTELPKIYDSLEIKKDDGSILVLEVQSHVGEDMVRTISMDSTDGLQRGAEVVSSGNPIQMPIGKDIYGRLFNVIGDAIDGMEDLPKSGKKYIVVVQHPVTTEFNQPKIHISNTLKAVKKACKVHNLSAVWLWPNVDAGTDIISKKLRIFKERDEEKDRIVFIKNLSPEDYLKLIYNSICIVGNSSSGIRESSYLGIPSVNIGSRQSFREVSKNVISCDHNPKLIFNSINNQIKKFKYRSSKLYGSGKASKKIIGILKKIKSINIKKKISYI